MFAYDAALSSESSIFVDMFIGFTKVEIGFEPRIKRKVDLLRRLKLSRHPHTKPKIGEGSNGCEMDFSMQIHQGAALLTYLLTFVVSIKILLYPFASESIDLTREGPKYNALKTHAQV
jgi:hypothetical protein